MPHPRDLNLTDLAKGLTGAARDATYVAVGLGVLGVQRLQTRRVAIQKLLPEGIGLEGRLGGVRTEVARHAGEIDGLMESALRHVESSLEPIEAQLPSPVRDAARLAHAGAHEIRIKIRELLGAA